MPRSGGPPETEFQILDGETQTCHWPPLLRALSAHAHTRATHRGPTRRCRIRSPDETGGSGRPRAGGEVPDRLGTPVRCWRRRAHALPEEPGIPDPDDPYARPPDGRKADVGILYLGAKPAGAPALAHLGGGAGVCGDRRRGHRAAEPTGRGGDGARVDRPTSLLLRAGALPGCRRAAPRRGPGVPGADPWDATVALRRPYRRHTAPMNIVRVGCRVLPHLATSAWLSAALTCVAVRRLGTIQPLSALSPSGEGRGERYFSINACEAYSSP